MRQNKKKIELDKALKEAQERSAKALKKVQVKVEEPEIIEEIVEEEILTKADEPSEILVVALANRAKAEEVAAAIDAVQAAAAVAAIGTTTNLVGVDGTGSNAAPLVETEARLDAIEAKVDEIIAALKASGAISS